MVCVCEYKWGPVFMLEIFSFTGRYGRVMFWFIMAISTGLSWLSGQLAFKKATFENGFIMPDTSDPRFWVSAGLVVLAFWLSAAACIKRLHDRGKTGWWYLLLFVPVFGPLWVLIELGLLPGTGRDDNGYGPRNDLAGRPVRKTASQEDREMFQAENRRRKAMEAAHVKDQDAPTLQVERRRQVMDRLRIPPAERTGFGRRRYI